MKHDSSAWSVLFFFNIQTFFFSSCQELDVIHFWEACGHTLHLSLSPLWVLSIGTLAHTSGVNETRGTRTHGSLVNTCTYTESLRSEEIWSLYTPAHTCWTYTHTVFVDSVGPTVCVVLLSTIPRLFPGDPLMCSHYHFLWSLQCIQWMTVSFFFCFVIFSLILLLHSFSWNNLRSFLSHQHMFYADEWNSLSSNNYW